MSLNTFLIFLLVNIYVTFGFNGNNSSTIPRQQKDEYNFGHSGYVYLPSDPTPPTLEFIKCQYYDVNVTSCSFMNKTPRTTQDIILMRAWLAVTLRDNIATIISYLLHLPNDILPNEIYSSLNLIYQEVQKNNIKVMDLLMRMKPIGKVNSISQLTMLFKSLHTVVPSYCRNAVDNVSKFFFKKKDKLKNTLSTTKEDGIDLFADIRMELIPLLRLKNPSDNFNEVIEAFHGKEYAILFSHIVEKKIFLSQPVLSVLMLNTRFNNLPPQTMEDLRYLADVLRYNKIKNWEFNGIEQEPYDLIHKALVNLKEVPEVDQVIKDTIDNLLKFLIKPLNTEDQPYYDEMKPFFTQASFNISLFFDQLATDLNTPDALILKHLVDNDKIKYPYAVKGFIQHYYDSPNKLRLAFLQRIKHRVPILKNDQEPLLNIISLLEQKANEESKSEGNKGYRIGKEKRNAISFLESPLPYPGGNRVFHSSIMICGTAVKYIDQLFNRSSKIVKDNLTESHICSYKPTKISLTAWLENLDDAADAELPIPMIQNVSTVLEIFLNNSNILNSVKSLIYGIEVLRLKRNVTEEDLKSLLESNDTKKLEAVFNSSGRYKIENISNQNVSEQKLTVNVTNESIYKQNASNQIVSNQNVSDQKISDQNVPIQNVTNQNIPSPYAFNITSRKPLKLEINSTENKITKKDQLIQILKSMLSLKNVRARPIVYYELIRLYSILVHGPNNHSASLNLTDSHHKNITGNLIGNNSLIVFNVLNDTEFAKNLSSIQFEDYPTKQHFLVALFKKMLTLKYVKQDTAIFNEVIRLLRSIIPLPIELDDLTRAIVLDSLDDAPWVHAIANFLLEPGTINNLGDDFDIGFYRTKGSLLNIILRKSMNITKVKENTKLSLAIEKMLPKIDCSTVGSEQVIGIEDGATTDMVDFKKLVKNGLDRKNMSSEVTEAFFNMTTWHGGTFDPLKYIREMNVSLYGTRAEFFEGFFENLARNIESKAAMMKKDIELMRTAIKKTGTGSEPVDYP